MRIYFYVFFLRNSMATCNRDLCKRHIPVVVNAIKRLANEKDNKKYIVLDLQLPETIDPKDYTAGKDGLFNFTFPRAVNGDVIDVTAFDTVKYDNKSIGTDGFYITPTLRYTNIDGETSTMDEYIVLDNNGGNPKENYGQIPVNPYSNDSMIYLKRTTTSGSSTVATTITQVDTNIRGLMFRIKIPWSMSVFYEGMSEQTQKEYDRFVGLMDNLTRFMDMRIDILDEENNPKFEAILPFKNYATSNNGNAIALTMAGSVNVGGFSTIGDIYWRFYPGGLVLVNQGKPDVWANKKIRLTLAYDE